uniref:Uncharacterized protein n=1 Tax=Lepeophtheirus salmonis TaxID=72036 RepID=A0A0K2UUE5_LEPSM
MCIIILLGINHITM